MATIRISTLRGTGGDSTVSIVGPTTVFAGSTNTYTITDYDDFSVYEVSSSIGDVTRTDETITLEVPVGATEEIVALSVIRGGSARVFRIALGGTGVATPSVTSPANGSAGVPTVVTIQATPFYTVPYGAGEQVSSQWQVARDAGFTNIVDEGTVFEGNMTRYTTGALPRNTVLYARVRYSSTIGVSGWSGSNSFVTVDQQINQPTITIVGGDFDVQETPTFNSSTFSTTPAGSDTHVASNWVLRDAITEDVVWQLNHSTSNGLSVTIPVGVLDEDSTYTMEVQHIGGFGTSVFSDRLTFSTASSFIPEEPGVPFGGGFYAGANILVDGVEYALIVAPKSQGGESSSPMQFRTFSTTTSPGAKSIYNGRANTAAYIRAGASRHPAANFCNNLVINGYDDWHLPSRLEWEICYRYLKPTTDPNRTVISNNGSNPYSVPIGDPYTSTNPSQTSVAIFQSGGGEHFESEAYWSSTEIGSSGSNVNVVRPINGSLQGNGPMYISYLVRAVRWVPVS